MKNATKRPYITNPYISNYIKLSTFNKVELQAGKNFLLSLKVRPGKHFSFCLEIAVFIISDLPSIAGFT